MRKFLFSSLSVLCAIFAMTSCDKAVESPETPYVPEEVRDLFGGATPTGYYSYAEMSVPAATEVVYIEYKGSDGSVKTVAQNVTPEVAVPTDGRDVEPFGTVKLLFETSASSQVSVYYKVFDAATKADGDDAVYTLENFPVDQVTSGEFGKTRYVQVPWSFGWMNNESTGYQNQPTYPKDVVMYDAEHNHTLRYTYVYSWLNGKSGVCSEGYVLTDAYNVEDHIAVSYKYNYCGGCGNCPYCMPWGCSCGCGSVNDAFQPNGDQVDDATDDGATTEIPDVPENIVPVKLQEPAPYVTTDEDYTMYHSSGVVMFDDSWPTKPYDEMGKGAYDYDFNDVVLRISREVVSSRQLKLNVELVAVGALKQLGAGIHLVGYGYADIDSVTTVGGESFNLGGSNHDQEETAFHDQLWDSLDLLQRGRHGEAVICLFNDAHWALGDNMVIVNNVFDRKRYNVSKTFGTEFAILPTRTVSYNVYLKEGKDARDFTLGMLDPFEVEPYNSATFEVHCYQHREAQVMYEYSLVDVLNLPWALMIPYSGFRYPLHGCNIGFSRNDAFFGAYMTPNHAFGQWVRDCESTLDWYLYPTFNQIF